jgi:3-dehydroquinate synthetase
LQISYLIAEKFGSAKCGIVTDENVAKRHLPALEASLAAVGKHAGSVVLKPGEATKCFIELASLSEKLLQMGLERGDLVVGASQGKLAAAEEEQSDLIGIRVNVEEE